MQVLERGIEKYFPKKRGKFGFVWNEITGSIQEGLSGSKDRKKYRTLRTIS